MEGFEELELDHSTGEGENQLVRALRSTCLWQKEYIKLPNWTPPPPPPPPASQGTPPPPPPPPPPPASDQGTPPPSPAPPTREGTPPPPSPTPARRSSPPPPPPCRQRRKTDAAAPAPPARRSTPPPSPPCQQRQKRSSTSRGGRQFRYGPSLKPLEKLPYEMTEQENEDIVRAQVKAHFERKRPPPKEKLDPVKAKRTIDALKRPPPPSAAIQL